MLHGSSGPQRKIALTTRKTTQRVGTPGNCVVKDGRKVIGLERKRLKTAINQQKNYSGCIDVREVTGSSPVSSTIQ